MVDIQLNSKRLPASYNCRLCDSNCIQLGTVDSFHKRYPPLDFGLCSNCSSISYSDKVEFRSYSTNNFEEDDYFIHYAQIGAGISAMIQPLNSINKQGELLDVGCGFGYVVDYWNRITSSEAIGMEVADYGKRGKKLLQLPIYHALLGDCTYIDNRTFDIIFSSEVIEHTEDPLAFCKSLASRCKKDGVVVLTTPSARAILEDNPKSTQLASLSPYYHYFLASKKGFEDLLEKAGFNHIHVTDSGVRLLAWASKSPLPEIDDDHNSFNWEKYFQYLDTLSNNPDRIVSSGALFRLFKDQWLRGYIKDSYKSFLRFEVQVKKDFDIDLRTICFEDCKEYIKLNDLIKAPAWLGVSLYIGSKILSKMERDYLRALNMAITSEKIIEYLLSDPKSLEFSQESEIFFQKIVRNRKSLRRKNTLYGKLFIYFMAKIRRKGQR